VRLYFAGGHYAQMLSAARRAIKLALATGDKRALAEAKEAYGFALAPLGRRREARRAFMEAIKLADMAGDLNILCSTLMILAGLHAVGGDLDRAVECLDRARRIAEQVGDNHRLMFITIIQGFAAYHQGDWDRAQAYYSQASDIVLTAEASWDSAYISLYSGALYLARGWDDRADVCFRDGLASAEASGDIQGLRFAHHALAERELLEGQPERAWARLEQLLDRAGLEEEHVTLWIMPLVAWAELERDGPDKAAHTVREALERALRTEAYLALPDLHRIQAMVLLRQRRTGQAVTELEQAITAAKRIPYPYAEAKARYVYGQVYLSECKAKEAHEQLEGSLAILNRLGERVYAKLVERTMLQSGFNIG
jgi:tetratricopeptide (TPR) repeat protein